jgi:hypothetical protein
MRADGVVAKLLGEEQPAQHVPGVWRVEYLVKLFFVRELGGSDAALNLDQ